MINIAGRVGLARVLAWQFGERKKLVSISNFDKVFVDRLARALSLRICQ